MSFFRIAITLILSVFANHSDAYTKEKGSGQRPINGVSEYRINEKLGTIEFIKVDPGAYIREESVLSWLEKDVLGFDENESLRLLKVETDKLGFTHYRYQQYYNDIKVEHGVFYIHVRNGFIETANGEIYPVNEQPSEPSITLREAYSSALKSAPENIDKVSKKDVVERNVVYYFDSTELRLAYKFDIHYYEPLFRAWIYIDAIKRNKLGEESRIHYTDVKGIAHTAYNGVVQMTVDSVSPAYYKLAANLGFGGINTRNCNSGKNLANATEFTDSDNLWNVNSIDKFAYDLHYGAECTYKFYLNRFGRNSYDNNGDTINAYMHYDINYSNAFWDGTNVVFGDGNYSNGPFTPMDIVGHELTHAVTEYSAGLVYTSESGALNESFSDCFGIAIDHEFNPLSANFLEGDQVLQNGRAFRDLANPNVYENPDCYNGLYWNAPNEVHNNSGVMNYFFYLLCEGGVGINDVGNSFQVAPVGMLKATDILYRALTVYLTPNSNYSDARYYTLLSAAELYGNCSDEVYNVYDAWYAVNVSSAEIGFIKARFNAFETKGCQMPASIQFLNSSLNATNYLWDFGDGDTSTDINPVHTYSTPGIYSVTLVVTGPTCALPDTLIRNNYINVSDVPGFIPTQCIPVQIHPLSSKGIFRVQLNDIDYNSNGSTEGHIDKACNEFTVLNPYDQHLLKITTSNSPEYVKAWIDYNNNGSFSSNEIIFSTNLKTKFHTGVISSILNPPLYTPLRLRIADDINPIDSACSNLLNGQAEDYSIYFIDTLINPVADFYTVRNHSCTGDSVQFYDLSSKHASSWYWEFPGGTPSVSTQRNPVIVYNEKGYYPVFLRVLNAAGSDSLLRSDYIGINSCVAINMCGTEKEIHAANAIIYDSGGPNGNYNNNEDCLFTYYPDCPNYNKLEVQFDSESGMDSLYVYRGVDTAFFVKAMTGVWDNLNTSGWTAYTFRWKSSSDTTKAGFSLRFYNDTIETLVLAKFFTSTARFKNKVDSVYFGTPLYFTNQGYGDEHLWEFGDNNVSIFQEPAYSYQTSGTHRCTLHEYTCTSWDTASRNIFVYDPPVAEFDDDTISILINCIDTLSLNWTIYNTGSGPMVYSEVKDSVRILFFATGLDTVNEFKNMIRALDRDYPRYKYTLYYNTFPYSLQNAMQNYDLLIFPKDEGSLTVNYAAYNPIIQNLIQNNKTVLICGTLKDKDRPFRMGFSGKVDSLNYFSRVPGGIYYTGWPLMENLPISVFPFNTHGYNITNSLFIPLLQGWNTNAIFAGSLGNLNIGGGNLILLGFDYFEDNLLSGGLLANVARYTTVPFNPYMTANMAYQDTIIQGDSTVIHITFNGLSNILYSYQSNLVIKTNDPSKPLITKVINLINICVYPPSGGFTISSLNNCNGHVVFNNNYTSNAPISYKWDFGDGSTDTSMQTDHFYQQTGTYLVKLIASNIYGTDTSQIMINVIRDTVNITIAGIPVTGNYLQFDVIPSGSFNSYLWDFGNGMQSTQNPSFNKYLSAGTYQVRNTAYKANCNVVTLKNITIGTTGVEELQANQIEVFSDYIQQCIVIKPGTAISEDGIIKVMDVTGRLLQQNELSISNEIINYYPQTNGLYLILIQSKSGQYVRKIIY